MQSFVNGPHASDAASHCERVCAQLRSNVFSIAATTQWHPKCMVVLHASRESYRRAVGAGASQTVGSSSVSFSAGRVTKRRIDLLAAGSEQDLAALPHEMMHVLFADAFPTNAPPKWAEEGLALSVDTAEKRSRHARDLERALRTRTTLPLNRIVADVDYPDASQRAAFYAQSLSLVDYLTSRSSTKNFIRYAKLSTEHGHVHALSAVYGLKDSELDRNWREYVNTVKLASWESN